MALEVMMAKEALRFVPVNQVIPAEVALRPVDTETEQWKELVQSVKSVGVLSPIVVREQKDENTGQVVYGLIDGLHRWTAAKEAGVETIPVHIVGATDLEALRMQIIGNAQKVETKPAQYSAQLKRMLALDPTLSVPQLASQLGKSAQWLNDRMNLTNLTTKIRELVDAGEIIVSNATHLAKLPEEEQANYVDRAMTMSPTQFVPTVNARVKELNEAKRQGRSAAPKTFEPIAFVRKMGEIRAEIENPQNGKALIEQTGTTDPASVWQLACKWILNLDPISVAAQVAKHEAQEAAKEEAKRKREEEREAKKASAAADTAVAVGA